MIVENIGNIADAYLNERLPKCGMIISATREELMEIAGNLLYREVSVIDAAIGKHYVQDRAKADRTRSMFEEQVMRCAEICKHLEECGDRTYTKKEVLQIIDLLLDGIKPKKNKVAK